jgi:trehalose 6-phosphate synthase
VPGLALFLHLPFPPPEVFLALPWRRTLMEALLAPDLIGFQSAGDRANFRACAAALGCGGGDGGDTLTAPDGRPVRLGVFPAGVDFPAIAREAAGPTVSAATARLRAELGEVLLVLGIDPLDPSRGLLEKLAAFEALLAADPGHQRRVGLLQVVEPAPGGLPSAASLREALERRVGELNGRFSRAGWQPIRYLHRHLGGEERLALHRVATVALTTPLEEGAALLAKEHCAARVEGGGTLVLSEFSGSAPELAPSSGRGALAVNPHDVEGLRATLHRALALDPGEREERMAFLRRTVAHNDLGRWADDFCAAGGLRIGPRATPRRRPALPSPHPAPGGRVTARSA